MNSSASERAKAAREHFIAAAPERGMVVVSSGDQYFEWRFAGSDPAVPAI